MKYKAKCRSCGYEFEPNQSELGAGVKCHQCDSGKIFLSCTIADKFESVIKTEEIDALTRENGDLVGELSIKTDGNTEASVRTAKIPQEKSKIKTLTKIERERRVSGFEEEGDYIIFFLREYNKDNSSNYRVEDKGNEDSDYFDRVIVSESPGEKRVGVQIRHLDSNMAGDLGKHKRYDKESDFESLSKCIDIAIEAKKNVDSELKKGTILLLILPAPINELIKNEFDSSQFDYGGFLEVWIASFRGRSFKLNPQTARE